jgi:hypothetical protein
MDSEGKKFAALAGGLGVAGLITYMIAHPAEARAAQVPEGVSPQEWEAIQAIIAGMQEQNTRLENAMTSLVSALTSMGTSGGGIAVSGVPENTATFNSGVVTCAVASPNKAYRMPGKYIPKGMEFVIKALDSNVGLIYVANNEADAKTAPATYRLLANEAIGLKIKNSNAEWISAQIAGEGVTWIVEQ